MKGYSLDLRERIVVAVAGGQSKTAVSERFGVSRSTVKRYVKRQEQGRLAPSKRAGRRRRLDGEGCEQLRAQVETHHDWTLERHAAEITQETGIEVKRSSIGNYLKRLGITHKKRAS
jgi:transposase